MAATNHALHKYPSVQTMRKVEVPTMQHVNGANVNGINGKEKSKGSYEVQDPAVHVKDFSVHYNGPISESPPSEDGSVRLNSPQARAALRQHPIHVTSHETRNGTYLPYRPPDRSHSRDSSPVSNGYSIDTYDSYAPTSSLPALQTHTALEMPDHMEPIDDDDPRSFDLVAPAETTQEARFSLETRSQQLFSRKHLKIIFADPPTLLRFTAFLSTTRPTSVPILIYYLDALKALKAINYANAVAEALAPLEGYDFTTTPVSATVNTILEDKANQAFEVLVKEDLPAYVTHTYIQIVSLSVTRRVTGTLASHLREASEGLAEVFCLTDPSRPDNPIVFASEEFNRTTQYGMGYVIGRNCRFLQGPKTNPHSVRRIRDSVRDQKAHCEVFLNYRRDGSPFMNMLMTAPLCDSRGNVRYYIGAQVDVSGLVKECTDLESLRRLVNAEHDHDNHENGNNVEEKEDPFRELSEMLNTGELETVRNYGGQMHRGRGEEDDSSSQRGGPHRPRLLLKEPSAEHEIFRDEASQMMSGKLSGVYQNYLLIRPYPSLRILFASPSLRVPGISQSPFMEKIGGSPRVRENLTVALADGRGVTAKVRWVSRTDEDGRNRWIHCTPLLGNNGQIGVWMIVIVDEEKDLNRRPRKAPPVDPDFLRGKPASSSRGAPSRSDRYDEYHYGQNSSAESIRGRREEPATRRYEDSRQRAEGSGSMGSSANSVRIY